MTNGEDFAVGLCMGVVLSILLYLFFLAPHDQVEAGVDRRFECKGKVVVKDGHGYRELPECRAVDK